MATIQFNPGLSWDNLPPSKVRRVIDLAEVVKGLKRIASDWQEVSREEGIPLVQLQASVGLLLEDICDVLQLDQADRAAVLGNNLVQ